MIESVKERVESGEYRLTVHAFERCVERNISSVILSAEIIEQYPEDKYGPSCLMWGTTAEGQILHVQCPFEPVWVITAYDPTLNPQEWDQDFKRRRSRL